MVMLLGERQILTASPMGRLASPPSFRPARLRMTVSVLGERQILTASPTGRLASPPSLR